MSWCHPKFTEFEALEWYRICEKNWDDGTEFEFSVFGLSGRYLGATGLNQLNPHHNFANLGYWISEPAQRQGYAAEAALLVAKFGFTILGLSRIEIVVAEDNLPSRRVAEKSGAIFEGILRNRLLIHSVLFSAAMYALLPNTGP
jgi:RimJ/RimL family protein N-acetyltransferase